MKSKEEILMELDNEIEDYLILKWKEAEDSGARVCKFYDTPEKRYGVERIWATEFFKDKVVGLLQAEG